MTKIERNIKGEVRSAFYTIDNVYHDMFVTIMVNSRSKVTNTFFEIRYYFNNQQKDISFEELSYLLNNLLKLKEDDEDFYLDILDKIDILDSMLEDGVLFNVNVIETERNGKKKYKLKPTYIFNKEK